MTQHDQQNRPDDQRRTTIGRKRAGGLVEHVVSRTRRREPVDPDAVVHKTYRLHAHTVEDVAQASKDHKVGMGELVEWLINEGLADLAAGRKHLPVVEVPPPVSPLGGKRRGRQPLDRRIASRDSDE
ncbi:MAG: hypothetical protein M3R24_28755 [Chloroflexota bacterium]|nr:hypothetical protein [Chloroflexota bacterium]